MNWTRHVVGLIVLALVFTLVGGAGIAQGQAVKNPDTLTLVRFGDPETLDPAYAYDTASGEVFLWNIYETLVFYGGTSTSAFVPMLATAVPTLANGGVTNGGRTYTFTLRSGVKFHDGSTMTAEDVKYSLLRFMFMDRDGGPSWLLLAPILGVSGTRDDKGTFQSQLFREADRAIQVSGNKISITLKRPFAPFMSIFASWSMVVSKKWAIAQGDWNGTAATVGKLNNPAKPEDTTMFTKANGTGPFKLVQWDRQNRQAILERNDSYWRAPAPLKRIIIRVVEDFGPRRLMLQQGDADIIDVNRPEQSQVEGISGVRIVDGLGSLVVDGIFFNLKIDTSGGNPDVGSGRLDGNGVSADFFADATVRRAFIASFDSATMIRDCWRGKAFMIPGPIPRGLLGFASSGKGYTYDRARAEALFREARGGQIWNTGFKFTTTFNAGNTTRQCMAQVFKSGVEALNPKFKVDVRGVTWAQYLSAYRASKFPVWIIGWAPDFPDPDNYVDPFLGSTGTYPSAQNYKNPEVDRLIEQARTEVDTSKRLAIYLKLEEMGINDAPTIWSQRLGFIVMRSWVRGWYFNPAFPTVAGYYYRMSKR